MDDEIVMQEQETAAGAVNPQGEAEEAAQSEQDGAAPARQSHEDNHRYQAARKRGEEAGYQRAMREINERIAKTGMRNPNSGEEITGIDGLEAYGNEFKRKRQEEIAKKSGRTVAEVQEEEANREFISQQRKAAQEKPEELNQKAQRDLEEFAEAFPDTDVNKLLENEDFRRFCRNDIGKVSLASLYDDYLAIGNKAKEQERTKAESKKERATGSGGGSGAEALTNEQQRELDAWNNSYPQLKMSAKEYLKYKTK